MPFFENLKTLFVYIMLSKCPNFGNTFFILIERFIISLLGISAIITRAAAKPKILERQNLLDKTSKVLFFATVLITYFNNWMKGQSNCPPTNPLGFMDINLLITVKLNQVFAFYVFLNLTIFNFGFKESI